MRLSGINRILLCMSVQLHRFKRCLLLIGAIAVGGVAHGQEPVAVSFQGKPIRFTANDRPYFLGRIPMISVRPVFVAMGAEVRRSRDAIHWTIRRGEDRLDYAFGDRWFIFNGARMELSTLPEGRGETLFAPIEFFEGISGGALELNADSPNRKNPEVDYRGKRLRFKKDDTPMRQSGTVFVSLQSTANFIGAHVEVSSERGRLTITRALDRVTYEQGTRSYVFNGAVKSLRTGSMVRGKTIFVPIELFQALVGGELRSR